MNVIISIFILSISLLISCSERGKSAGVHAAFYSNLSDRCSISLTNGKLVLTDTNLNYISVVKAHSANTTSSFFSSSDKYIVTGGGDSLIHYWSLDTLQKENTIRAGFFPYTSIMGNKIIAACGEDSTLMISYFNENIEFKHKLSGPAHFLYFLQTDTFLLVTSGNKCIVFDIINNRIRDVYNSSGELYCVMPSADKKKLIAASKNGAVDIFNVGIDSIIHHTIVSGEATVACYFSNDSLIAVSSSFGKLLIYSNELNKIGEVSCFDARINTIHFNAKGNKALIGSDKKGLKLIDINKKAIIRYLSEKDFADY